MDLIYKKSKSKKNIINTHIPFITQVGFQTKPKVPQKRFVNTASTKDKTKFKKE